LGRCGVTLALSLSLGACAIDGDEVTEDEELDEVAQAGIVTTVDYVISATGNPPASLFPGSAFTATDITRNQGSSAATVSTRTTYFLSTDKIKSGNDIQLGLRNVAALGAGSTSSGSASVAVPPNTAAGSYFVLACADTGNLQPESNETNNCRASNVGTTVTGPDLRVTAVGNPPSTGDIGMAIGTTDTTLNQGQTGSASTTVGYYLSLDTTRGADDVFLGTRQLTQLLANASEGGGASLTIPSGTPAGSYRILACADYPTSLVKETNETNNCLASAGQMLIGAGPDLRVASMQEPPASAVSGAALTLQDMATNQGGAAAGATTTRLYLSLDTTLSGTDLLLGGHAVNALGAGDSQSFSGSYTVPSGATGTYFLLACADRLNQVAESNETNNCRASVGTMTIAGPNLLVSVLDTADQNGDPQSAFAGQPFTMTATVANEGSTTAPASQVYYYWSTDDVKSTDDFVLTTSSAASVASASSVISTRTITFPSNIAAGGYFLIACADGARTIGETDERDNCEALFVDVTAP
jgi:subtilase family serine protease